MKEFDLRRLVLEQQLLIAEENVAYLKKMLIDLYVPIVPEEEKCKEADFNKVLRAAQRNAAYNRDMF